MKKSVLGSFLLCLFFGPLGLLYTGIAGGIIWTVIAIGLSWTIIVPFLVWGFAMIWGPLAAVRHNRQVEEQRLRHEELLTAVQHQAA
jgi:hypothetical protein